MDITEADRAWMRNSMATLLGVRAILLDGWAFDILLDRDPERRDLWLRGWRDLQASALRHLGERQLTLYVPGEEGWPTVYDDSNPTHEEGLQRLVSFWREH